MGYLDKHSSYSRSTGSTFEQWCVMFELSPEFAHFLDQGLPGFAQINCLDAAQFIPAGGMKSTGLGQPFPLFLERS
jgi:hypothetical protein